MDRRSQICGSHRMPQADRRREICGVESVEAGPQTEVGVVWVLGLHPDQMVDHLESGLAAVLQQVLAGESGPVQFARG